MLKKITLLIISFLLIGCISNKPIVSEKNNQLSKTFINMYIFLDYSNLFSDTIGKLTNDLLKKKIITIKEKNIIGKYWKEHKKYHNELQFELDIWYNHIENNESYTFEKKLYDSLKKVMLNSDILLKIVNKIVEEEGIYIPDDLFNNMSNLYITIIENKG